MGTIRDFPQKARAARSLPDGHVPTVVVLPIIRIERNSSIDEGPPLKRPRRPKSTSAAKIAQRQADTLVSCALWLSRIGATIPVGFGPSPQIEDVLTRARGINEEADLVTHEGVLQAIDTLQRFAGLMAGPRAVK